MLAAGLKVKEVPSYVTKYANEHWQPPVVQRRVTTWLNNYKKQVGAVQAEAILFAQSGTHGRWFAWKWHRPGGSGTGLTVVLS